MTRSHSVKLLDFRVLDQTLYESDPDAGNVVTMGSGNVAYPFTVARRIAGPSGWYVDTCRIEAPGGLVVAEWNQRFELEGASVDRWVVDTRRGVVFPGQGSYTLRYLVFDAAVVGIDFEVVASQRPFAVVVPGPIDAALGKGTIAWLAVSQGKKAGDLTKPVWYGYEGGLVYVLTGPGEQQVPGLESAGTVRLLARSKDKQSLVGEMICSVHPLEKDAEWDRIARDVMIGRRLNLVDGEQALERWRKTCEIAVLTPAGAEVPQA